MPEYVLHEGDFVKFAEAHHTMAERKTRFEGEVGRVVSTTTVKDKRKEALVSFRDDLLNRFWIQFERLELVEQDNRSRYPYRWKDETIEIVATEETAEEVIEALNEVEK